MILENIAGEVKVLHGNKILAIGDTFKDAEYASVKVVGKGKATFRVDQNSTVERYGIKAEAKEMPAEIKVAPVTKAAKPAEPEAPTPSVEPQPATE